MPTPEAPKEISKIPGISEESAQQLENDPDLLKVLLVQEESGKSKLIAVLKEPKNTISMNLWGCLEKIGCEANIIWACIPKSQEERTISRYQETVCLFESSSASQK